MSETEKDQAAEPEKRNRKTADLDVPPPEPRVDDLTPSDKEGSEQSKVTHRQD